MYENDIKASSYNNSNPAGGNGSSTGDVNSGNGGNTPVNNSAGIFADGSGGNASANGSAGTYAHGSINTAANSTGAFAGGNANAAGTFASNTANGSGYAADSRNGSGSPYFDYTTYPTGSAVFAAEDQNRKKRKEKKPRKPMTGFGKVMFSAGIGLCFGIFAGAGFYAVKLGADRLLPESQEQLESQQQPPAINATMGNNVALQPSQLTYVTNDASDVVESVMPAMVTIVNTYTVTGTSIWGQTYSQQQQGGGTGIIVAENDNELLIVSNNHVVEGADDLEVTFSDGSTAKASIKGLDSDMDLAVIAVNLKDLSSETRGAIAIATLGDSSTLKMGNPVIIIGNALGYGQSVTTGCISALDREMTMEDGTVGTFIQTDAAVNQGNSGGALLNIKGEVIGIISSKIGGSKVDNVGFAIPISSASPIIAELMERQTRTKVPESDKGYLGIEMLTQEVPEEIMTLYGMPQGVYIAKVQEGCAAEKAGIIQRDVVVKIDGVKVTSRTELQKEMEYHAAGDTIKVTIKRLENGEYVTYDLDVTLGKRP